MAANKAAADEARLIVGQYARSIYMSGSTDLSVLASMIDTEDPGDLMSRADEALIVGNRKDDQYNDAVRLLKRNEEVKQQADSARMAAEASLESISNQVNGLQRQLADVANKWADHLAGASGFLDADQAKANSEAAARWADYLGRFAVLGRRPRQLTRCSAARCPRGSRATTESRRGYFQG
ncbi:MAG: hypothetical protein V9E82_04000 [Candidatus Nanopelagicales bacterium]